MDDTKLIKWWVDGSYGVHDNMRSHTGVIMSMGKGVVYYTSHKQELNIKISTEMELVATDDVMTQLLWTRYFLEAWGYRLGASKMYQDNMSAMLLEKNGKASIRKRKSHISIRSLFVKDKVNALDVTIDHCTTDDMWGGLLH